MKLFDAPLSPYAMKVRMILYEKGIEFEKHEIYTHADARELQKLNPRVEVPALVDGETVLCDSKVIAEYLEEVHPEPALLPKDPAARAQCRALELSADTEVDAAVIALSIFKFFGPEMEGQYPEAIASLSEKHEDPFFDPNRLHWRGDRVEQLLRIGLGEWLLAELAADRAFLPPAP